jgi:hypothetical protein
MWRLGGFVVFYSYMYVLLLLLLILDMRACVILTLLL